MRRLMQQRTAMSRRKYPCKSFANKKLALTSASALVRVWLSTASCMVVRSCGCVCVCVGG
jgi:1,4-dihydroxy-2-naphthoate octaprenyltransferase